MHDVYNTEIRGHVLQVDGLGRRIYVHGPCRDDAYHDAWYSLLSFHACCDSYLATGPAIDCSHFRDRYGDDL